MQEQPLTNPRKSVEVASKDTGSLDLEQLSDDELATILYIERRLYEAQDADLTDLPTGRERYQATVQKRHPRVLLLDGARGTGKTSLLLTLADRWHHWSLKGVEATATYKKRIEQVCKSPKFTSDPEHDFKIPTHVMVVGRILDFDPLPPEMPLIAGIVQAWRPLATQYDQLSSSFKRSGASGRLDDTDDDAKTLMDLWHQLFQMAAIGWSATPRHKGLIEQVLDREEQLQDWQRLDEHWLSFVNEVIKQGQELKGTDELPKKPVFVIMIDDVDLQVGRIRELLPALRLLYHPRVVFLVAADRYHMIEMLEIDFLGQQNRAANRQLREDELRANDWDQWPSVLAKSSFDKVFPLRNRWKLNQLSLYELLAFPNTKQVTLMTVLDGWPHQDKMVHNFGSLGGYLKKMSGSAEDPTELPPIMPYRAAHQIYEQALEQGDPKTRALKAICQIIGRSDSDDLLRITKRRNRITKRNEPDPTIEYLATGELTALFPKALLEPIENDSEVVLSAHPSFVYFHGPSRESVPTTGSADNVAKFISALIAASLREDGYGVVAPGLRWDIRLALAWTGARLFEGEDLSLDLAFRWQLHEHPSPMRLLTWTKEWRDFIHDLAGNTELRLQRIAYAWIYYQLRWMGGEELIRKLSKLPPPFDEKFNLEKSWTLLLSLEPQTGGKAEKVRWKGRILPLMARPELGLPVEIQKRLLKPMKERLDIDWLWDQRRRLVTDAIVAAAELAGNPARDAENQQRAERATEVFENRHKKTYAHASPWSTAVEEPVRAYRKTHTALDKQ